MIGGAADIADFKKNYNEKSVLITSLKQKIDELERDKANLKAENECLKEQILDLEACE